MSAGATAKEDTARPAAASGTAASTRWSSSALITTSSVADPATSPWGSPMWADTMPRIAALAAAYGRVRTVVTRFVADPALGGSWAPYYEAWPFALVPGDDPLYAVVPELAGVADHVVTAVDRKPKSTARLRRLHNIEVTPAVCLLADGYAEDWSTLWWVRADGGARIVPPDAPDLATREEYEAALVRLRAKYPQYRDDPPAGPVIVVAVHDWTGWQADPASAPHPAG